MVGKSIRNKMVKTKEYESNAPFHPLAYLFGRAEDIKEGHTMLGQVSMRDGMASIIQIGSGARYRVKWNPPSPRHEMIEFRSRGCL
jgi:hypothetical protein